MDIYGLPLCLAFLKAKFKVYGIDNSLDRIKTLKKKTDICLLSKNHKLKKLIITILYQLIILKEILKSIYYICVPTPIKTNKKPNMSYVKNVVKQINKYVKKKNQTIILECTSYPGTTEEFFLPIFNKKKFNVGKNIFLGYSPEREDLGNYKYTILKKFI